MASNAKQLRIPVQCVENPKGLGGFVIYDDKTVPMTPQQNAAGGFDLQSTVQPFRCALEQENRDAWDPSVGNIQNVSPEDDEGHGGETTI